MSSSIKICPYIKFPIPMNLNKNPILFRVPNVELNSEKFDSMKKRAVASFSQEAVPDNSPISIQMEKISSEEQFNNVLDQAQQLKQSLVVVWVASWCRKCIYLKPKLEKLAADYHPSIRFYSVDVNTVSHKLIARAEVTKMPTVQLWSDGKKQGEVIGGSKAHLVVNEVREMIENESSSL